MNEARIRQIIREEMYRANNASRFNGITALPDHIHNGVDAPKIKAENIIPATSVVGNIEFAQAQKYSINLNSSFTPQNISINGIAAGVYDGVGVRCLISGQAILTKTLYLQPSDTSSVIVGDIEYPFNGVPAQNSSSISVLRDPYAGISNPVYATSSEFHIVSINFPTSSNIVARATVTEFSRSRIVIDVSTLESGWSLFINFTIS